MARVESYGWAAWRARSHRAPPTPRQAKQRHASGHVGPRTTGPRCARSRRVWSVRLSTVQAAGFPGQFEHGSSHIPVWQAPSCGRAETQHRYGCFAPRREYAATPRSAERVVRRFRRQSCEGVGPPRLRGSRHQRSRQLDGTSRLRCRCRGAITTEAARPQTGTRL